MSRDKRAGRLCAQPYDAIAEPISKIPAKTFAGLAVQLCKDSYPQIFACPTADADHRYLRMLVDEIETLGNLPGAWAAIAGT